MSNTVIAEAIERSKSGVVNVDPAILYMGTPVVLIFIAK